MKRMNGIPGRLSIPARLSWIAFASIAFLTLTAFAVRRPGSEPSSQASRPTPPPLLLGAAWYPEQWPESRWKADLDLMRKAHIHVVRVGEFAWSTEEPREGEYHFGWLERAIDEAGKRGIYTVIGTPTAGPPAWLKKKYPQILRVDENGRPALRGVRQDRQQFNFDSPRYREFCRDIATRLARRFGHNPYVIGWQIDNEYRYVSFDSHTRTDFEAWLKNYYGTLDNLNKRWTTAYSSQTYTSWDQIPIPTWPASPGLLLSWKRFVSDTWRGYQQVQIDAVRKYAAPRQFITTNMMGWFDGYDMYEVAKPLDLAAFDDYVGYTGHLDPYENGYKNDLVHGFKRKNYWILETQPGNRAWMPINNALNKGEVRAIAWENVGHGANALVYWQWRSSLNGEEQYHGVLVGPNGEPVPPYPEVAQVGREFMKAGPVLAGTSPHSQVAILHSYASFWAINWQPLNKNYDPVHELLSYYKPLRQIAQSVDIVQPTDDLSQYKLVVAPGLNIITPAIAKNLIQYVKNGGNLVLGQRTGMKDSDDALQPEQPGLLIPLLGGRVAAYYSLRHPVPVSGQLGNNTSKLWAEMLSVRSPQTKVLERYGKTSNGWLDGQPAIVTRKVGKGSITYVGVWMDDAGMKRLTEWMVGNSGVTPAFGPAPEGVDVNVRYGKSREVVILVNLAKEERAVKLPGPMQDVLKGGTVTSVSLPRYGVAVLSRTTGR